MKKVSTPRILSIIYHHQMRDDLNIINGMLNIASRPVSLTFNSSGSSAYTHMTKSGNPHIVIGGGLIKSIASMPEDFEDKTTFLPYWEAVNKAFWGLDLHEMGHNRYTDMYSTKLSKYPNAKFRNFLHSLFNTLEDPIIEGAMCDYYAESYPSQPNPEIYFNYIIESLFMPQAAKYKDDGSVNSFMQYLLLLVRCGKKNIKNPNAVFVKYNGDLVPRIRKVIAEPDGSKRIDYAIELGEWIIDNVKEFDWSTVTPPPHSSTGLPSPGGAGGGGTPMPVPGGAGGSSVGSGLEDGEEGEDGEDSSSSSSGAGGTGTPPTPKSPAPYSPVNSELDDVFNDIYNYEHEWFVVKDNYEIVHESLLDDINQKIENFDETIKAVSDYLELFHGRHKPRRVTGFTSGRLDLRRAMQDDIKNGCDTKLFSRNVQRGKDVDLAVTLIVDNSGSMEGNKSVVATQAALVLAQACEWSKIPFECCSFTESDACYTFIEKSFEDKFEDSKPYFGVIDSVMCNKLTSDNPIAASSFCSNIDEVNIYRIWKKLQRVEHEHKLMIVMSDGMTCGSATQLRELINEIEDSGIPVIGIGILDNNVAKIYKNHKIFANIEELQAGLADFLISVLSQYAS